MQSKKPSMASSAIGTDEVLSAADPCTPSIEDNVDVEVTGVRKSENEDGHKCSCLTVSGKKQHSSELQPAAVAGDGFDLHVILLKLGEKFPETRIVHFLPSSSRHTSTSDKDEALQVSEEISAGNEFDLPPVVLLKPGEKFKEQQSLDFIHCSKYYIFDANELATDYHRNVRRLLNCDQYFDVEFDLQHVYCTAHAGHPASQQCCWTWGDWRHGCQYVLQS